jgi:HSP20 family protein
MSAISRWDPFRALRRGDVFLEEFFRDMFQHEEGMMQPAAEVAESDGEVTVKMAVPGVEKDQLQITVNDDVLNVRGEVKKETEEKKKNYYRQEIRYGAFQRSVALPCDVDASKAKAELKNGMLTLTLPKATPQKTRTIEISAS